MAEDTPQTTGDPMPVIFLSHGAPPLADDPLWTRQLADWFAQLPKPKSVLMISAHWENDPLTVSATRSVPLVYDFWGFPERYYEVTYPAPGAPDHLHAHPLSDRVTALVTSAMPPPVVRT